MADIAVVSRLAKNKRGTNFYFNCLVQFRLTPSSKTLIMENFYIFLACCTLNFSFVVSAGMQINENLYMDKAKSKIYFFLLFLQVMTIVHPRRLPPLGATMRGPLDYSQNLCQVIPTTLS